MKKIIRKSLLYKTSVEYGDFTINHIVGCSNGCKYPCYAMNMAKRFGRIKTYEEWIQPKIVANALELLDKEIPKYKDKIKFVHLSFMTDPFMMGYPEVHELTLNIIKKLNQFNIKVTVLTKGVFPEELILKKYKPFNEYGITLVSLNKDYKKNYEPYSANYKNRINSLKKLHNTGLKTWVSIEPYPTPNIVEQDIKDILEKVQFVDKIIFGKLNYNVKTSSYKNHIDFYNSTAMKVIDFCERNKIDYHIKKDTIKNRIEENNYKITQNLFNNQLQNYKSTKVLQK
ncbi:MAG: radical SAM protein [Candidatus Cloacimonetes bacterium]|nr:radical SAM protein [Candidatus Cloacimonadota bacterium]